jgi:hypothetical protein
MTPPSLADGKRNDVKMTLVLGGAVVAAVALSVYSSRATHDTPLRSEDPASVAMPVTGQAAQADPTPAAEDSALNGDVLETLPVSKYTYLRLHTSSGEVWAAVPSAAIAVGSHVAIANATRMDDFKSTTLKRTFNVIYFGTLAAVPAADSTAKFSVLDTPPLDDEQALPPDHPDLGAAGTLGPVSDSDPLPPGHPDIGSTAAPSLAGGESDALPVGHPDIGGAAPHGGAADPSANTSLPLIPIEPARGPNARDISQLDAQRQKLAGHRVRVRGQVVKVTPDVNGRAFFHLRDSSGAAKATDLVVTAIVPPKLGQVATFEGTLRTDVDVGLAYKYPVLLEDAILQEESATPL